MNLVKQARFAEIIDRDKSYITRLKQRGRLVMVGDKVDVDASLKRIEETRDPNRDDVARRHAARREESRLQDPATHSDEGIGDSYQHARAVKEKYLALQARADYHRSIGELVPMAAVRLQGMDLGATVRVHLEAMPHHLAPVLAPIDDPARIHALLVEEVEAVLRELAHKTREMADKVAI